MSYDVAYAKLLKENEALTLANTKQAEEIKRLDSKRYRYQDDPEMVWTEELGWMHVLQKEHIDQLQQSLQQAKGWSEKVATVNFQLKYKLHSAELDNVKLREFIKALEHNHLKHCKRNSMEAMDTVVECTCGRDEILSTNSGK